VTVVDIDTTTGEILDRRPVLATPGSPITAQQIAEQCRSIEVWAEHCESIPELREADNRLAAIGEYLERTTTTGRNAVAAARLRLEARIGALLGPAERGGDRRSDQVDRDRLDPTGANLLTKDQRSQFRKLADHPEIVEAVINDSDDENPASRRRALDEINRARHAPPPEPGPDELRLRRATAIARAAHKAHELFVTWRPEDVHGLNDPDIADVVERLLDLTAGWAETYRATKPIGLRIVKGDQ